MDNALSLTPDQNDIINLVCTRGTKGIKTPDQVDVLIEAMLRVGVQTYNTVVAVINEDKKLCETIAKRMHTLADKVIVANNAIAQEIIDTCKANCESIRKFMENPSSSDVSIAECFTALREYTDKMTVVHQSTQAQNDAVMQRADTYSAANIENSKKNSAALKGAAYVAGGLGIVGLVVLAIQKLKK